MVILVVIVPWTSRRVEKEKDFKVTAFGATSKPTSTYNTAVYVHIFENDDGICIWKFFFLATF